MILRSDQHTAFRRAVAVVLGVEPCQVQPIQPVEPVEVIDVREPVEVREVSPVLVGRLAG